MSELHAVTTSIFIVAYLIIDQQLNGIVPPFNQDYLVGLSWHTIGEWCPYAWAGAGLEPHAHSEGIHFREALLDAPVQVVGTEREGHLEILRWFEGIVTCWWTTSSVSAMEIHFIRFQSVVSGFQKLLLACIFLCLRKRLFSIKKFKLGIPNCLGCKMEMNLFMQCLILY